MKVVKDYEQRAQQCRELAKTALPAQRAAIEKVAATWDELAAERRRALKSKNANAKSVVR
jgi:hypothetical protein